MSMKPGQYRLRRTDSGMRISECGLIRSSLSFNPHSEIRIPQFFLTAQASFILIRFVSLTTQ
ncbi:MAG: hypothetical protein AUG51_06780 [Acidobacteria bacterium 13_1_20CM_3_53_8]|nr:MAG: hypothetical protein AUG51_06780 [Acidobacteria bacterium 13_1_20CM_3_53_8]